MPRYRVKDSQTGTSLLLEGDSPPTEDELVQIFSERAKSKPAPRETIDPRTILESGVRSATELTDVVMRSISSPAAGEAAKAGRDQLQSEREQVLTTAIDVTGAVLKTLQNPAAGEASQMGRDAAQAERNAPHPPKLELPPGVVSEASDKPLGEPALSEAVNRVFGPEGDELHVGEEVRGLGRSLERGGRRFVQALDVVAMEQGPDGPVKSFDQAKREYDAARSELKRLASAGRDKNGRMPNLTELDAEVYRLGNEVMEARHAEYLKKRAGSAAVSFAKQQAEINKLPPTKAAEEFQKPETPWWMFFKNPIELSTQATAESLPIMAIAMAGAPAGPVGVATAAGLGSHTAESAARITNAMQNDGVDLSSGESVLAWFNDKAKSDPAIAKANLAALGPASFDALTGGIAGRWLRRVVGKGLKPVAIATGKEIGVQMTGGGLGSIVASALAGEPIDWKDVVLEVAGEIAPGEAIANVQAERAYARIAQTAPLTAQALRETEQVKPADPVPAAPPVETSTVAELQANLDKAVVETTNVSHVFAGEVIHLKTWIDENGKVKPADDLNSSETIPINVKSGERALGLDVDVSAKHVTDLPDGSVVWVDDGGFFYTFDPKKATLTRSIQKPNGKRKPPSQKSKETPPARELISAGEAEVVEPSKSAGPPTRQFFIKDGNTLRQVTLAQASEIMNKAREGSDLGSRELGNLKLYDINGKPVAHISYNGRIWEGEKYKAGAQELFPERPISETLPPKPATPAEGVKAFEVDEELVMRSPHTGEDTQVSYRGPLSGTENKAVVWTGKLQYPVPVEWLRRKGEAFKEVTKSSGSDQTTVGEGAASPSPIPSKPIPPLESMTKSQLIDELAGEKPSYAAQSIWDREKNARFGKFTKPELVSRANSNREMGERQRRIDAAMQPILPRIQKLAADGGHAWKSSLRRYAEQEGLRYSPPHDVTRGDAVYILSRALAEREIKQPSAASDASPKQGVVPAVESATTLKPTLDDLVAEHNADQGGRQSPEKMRIFSEIGTAIEPGLRLGDAYTVGESYVLYKRGEMTLAEFNKVLADHQRPLGLPENGIKEATPKSNPDSFLSVPVPDTVEAETAAKYAERQIDTLRKERQQVEEQIKELGKGILTTRGRAYQRGQIKKSAKAADVKAYRDAQTKAQELGRQADAIMGASGKDREIKNLAEFARRVNDPKAPLVERLGARQRLYEKEGAVPPEFTKAFDEAATEAILQKYPDATGEEIAQMLEIVKATAEHGSVESSFKMDPRMQMDGLRQTQIFDAVRDAAGDRILTSEELPAELKAELSRKLPGWNSNYYDKNTARGAIKRSTEPISAMDVVRLESEIHKATDAILARQAAEKLVEEGKAAEEARQIALAEDQAKGLVVEAEKIVGTASGRTGKAIKEDLVERIEKAIDEAPEELGGDGKTRRIAIGVPGDGVFVLTNTKADLRLVLERANKIPTTKGDAVSKGPYSKISEPNMPKPFKSDTDLAKNIKEDFAEPEGSTRYTITGVHSDGKTLTASNGRMVVKVDLSVSGKANNPEGFPIENVSKYTDKANNAETTTVSVEDLWRASRMAQKLEWESNSPKVDIWIDKNGTLFAEAVDINGDYGSWGAKGDGAIKLPTVNADYLERMASLAKRVGNDRVKIGQFEEKIGDDISQVFALKGDRVTGAMMEIKEKVEPKKAEVEATTEPTANEPIDTENLEGERFLSQSEQAMVDAGGLHPEVLSQLTPEQADAMFKDLGRQHSEETTRMNDYIRKAYETKGAEKDKFQKLADEAKEQRRVLELRRKQVLPIAKKAPVKPEPPSINTGELSTPEPMEGDTVTWTTGDGRTAKADIRKIRPALPDQTEPTAEVEWFGIKEVPISKLTVIKSRTRENRSESQSLKFKGLVKATTPQLESLRKQKQAHDAQKDFRIPSFEESGVGAKEIRELVKSGFAKKDHDGHKPTIAATAELAHADGKPFWPGEHDINTGALGEGGMGGAKPAEFVHGKGTPTSNKNATVDAERAARGLPPMMAALKHGWGQAWNEAMAHIDLDPGWQDRLIVELTAKPRAITDVENAALLHRRADLRNELEKSMRDGAQAYEDGRTEAVADAEMRTLDWSNKLSELENVTKQAGTELGRGLAARKMMMNEDFSLASLELQKRAANGFRELTTEEHAQLVEIQKKLQDTEKAYEEYVAKSDARLAEAQAARKIAELKAASFPRFDKRILDYAETVVSKMEKAAEPAAARIRERLMRMGTSPDPTLIYDAAIVGSAKLARLGLNIAQFADSMVRDFGEKIRPFVPAIWDESNRLLESALAKVPSVVKHAVKTKTSAEVESDIADAIQDRMDKGERSEIAPMVQKLARLFITRGIKEREELITAVHEVLKTVDPDFTRRETMDAISGYGNFKQISKDEISVQLRDLKGQMQQVAKLQDMVEGRPPLKTGLERRLPSVEESRLIKLVNEAKNKFQIPISDSDTQLKSSLDTLKTRLKNKTAELEDRLARGDFSKKAPKRVVQMDAEANRLHYENAKVKKQWFEALMRDRLARRSIPMKILGGVGEVLNTTRAVLTSLDLSAVLRQGGFIAFAHPVRALQSFPAMFRALLSEAGQHAVNQEILSRKNYPLYQSSKLYLSEHGQKLSQMEEAYMSRWADKIPLVAASQRAYVTFLNKLRADSFDAMANSLVRSAEITPVEAATLSNFINVATGRGSLGMKENALVGMNTIFFAPRYVASRFQLIAGQPLYGGTARTRTLVASEYGRFLIGAALVYGLASMAGAEIETDPRSADFGKLKFGNTRIDPMAGLLQGTVLITRLTTGETKDKKGKIVPIRGDKVPYGRPTSASIMGNFARTKLAPVPGKVVDILAGKNVVGEPVTPSSVVTGLTVPLALRDIYATMIEQGVPAGTAMAVLSIFGMGLQNYDSDKKPGSSTESDKPAAFELRDLLPAK